MKKLIVGMVVGVVVSFALVMGLLIPLSAAAGFGDSDESYVSGVRNTLREALTLPFQEVEKEIEDEQIAGFYHKLLEKTGLAQVEDESTDLETPDGEIGG